MTEAVERQSVEADIVCVGFGPATGGFLTTLTRAMTNPDGTPALESRVAPGMPLQVMCYERADDLGFGVSGVVTRGRAIRASFPDLDPAQIPMAQSVKHEKVVYLQDPFGASRRSAPLKAADAALGAIKWALPGRDLGVELPIIPPFLQKHDGLLLSIGQFNQWVASQLMMSGLVQIWPATPVQEALVENDVVVGVRLADQGVDKSGKPTAAFMPGLDVRAALTVVGDGPVGAVGQQLNRCFGMPQGHHEREWAVGMKMVVELAPDCGLEEGLALHTFGYPEPEIFGFLYVYPNRLASLGIFVPSFLESPVRTSYRYLQHWIRHPYLWKHLAGATMKSWGAKTLQESGRRGEPHLCGNGFARIGEGSGSTNVLTGSGVDEAWMTGVLLGEAVIELAKAGKPFSRENLEATYVKRRRASWLDEESKVAERSRDGFRSGFVKGFVGMGLTGLTGGLLSLSGPDRRPYERVPTLEEYYAGVLSADEIARLRDEAAKAGVALNELVLERVGWPKIEYDGKLLMSQQDALLVGGKVQAPEGYSDHVVFLYPSACESCRTKLCIEICSAQAIMPGEKGIPSFDREKCIHCGACYWNCVQPREGNPEVAAIDFRAGAGGLHSAEN